MFNKNYFITQSMPANKNAVPEMLIQHYGGSIILSGSDICRNNNVSDLKNKRPDFSFRLANKFAY